MFLTIRIIWNYWRRSFLMVFPCFFLPLIIFLIISSFFSTKTLLASMLCVVGLFNGVISMAVLYNDFKKTVIKKLKITPLSPFNFTFGLIIFNALTTIASIFLLFFIGIATYNKDINIKEIHFGWFLVAVIFTSVNCSLIGFGIGIISKNTSDALNIGLLINLPSSFLSRIYLPHIIKPHDKYAQIILKFLEYASPFSPIVSIFNRSFFHWDPKASDYSLYEGYFLPVLIELSFFLVLFFIIHGLYKSWKY